MWFQSKKNSSEAIHEALRVKKRRMDIHSPFFCPLSIRERKASPPPSYRRYAHAPSSVYRVASHAFAPPKRNITYPPPIKTVVSSSGNPLYSTPQRPSKPPRLILPSRRPHPGMAHPIHRKRAALRCAALSQLFQNPPSSGAASHSPSNRTRYHRRMFPLHAKRKRPRDTATR